MASSVIPSAKFEIGNVVWTYTIPANGTAQTNLAELIDDNLPDGYKCLGIVGFRTNSTSAVPITMSYSNVNDSLKLKNISSSAIASTGMRIYYLRAKV